MKNNAFRRLLAMAAVGAMLTSIAACGSSSSDDTASNGSDSTSLISVNNSEPQNGLIPSDTNEMGGGRVIRYLFEGLVSFDAKGKQHLEVAESITPNEDATKYTIKLKKGWKFTNGEAVTAHSFADTWSFAANVKNAQKTASRFSTIKGYDELQDPNVDPKATLSGLSTPDDYTLVVELNKPDSEFPTKLAHQSMFPLPSVAFKDIKKFGQAPIGNGPYKFKSWSHDKNIIIVPNKDYKGSRKVSNKGIEYRVYTNEDSAYSDVLSGNLDVMDQIPQSAVKTFRQDSSVIAYSQAGSSFQSFVIPERLEHFGNDEEGQLRRQAISMAINRDQVVKKVYNNTKTPATDFTSPLVPEYVKKLEQNGSNLKYNASKAKELWKKANAIKPWSGNFRIAYNADGAMLLPLIAVGLRLTQGFLTCRSDEIITVAQFDSPLLKQIITRLGKHDMLGLFLDGTRYVDRILRRGQTARGTNLAIDTSHQAGIHGYDAFTRQCSATTSVELRSILHNTDSRAHGILRRSPLLQQRIASFKSPVQILLHLGTTFRRILFATIAGTRVNHQQNPVRISLGDVDRRLRQCSFVH